MNLPPLAPRQTALLFVLLLLLLAQGQVVHRQVIATVQLHRKTCMQAKRSRKEGEREGGREGEREGGGRF
jgi:hypothetical protein